MTTASCIPFNESAFTDAWDSPQRDGPALRATALIKYGSQLLISGKQFIVKSNIAPLVSNN